MADPLFRSASDANDASFTSATDSATLPAGTASGDGMIIIYDSAFLAGSGAPTHTTPAGWTLVGSGTYAGTVLDGRRSIYAKVAGGSEGAVTLTSNANAAHIWQRLSYQNAHPTDWASGVTALFGTTASGTTHTLPSITTDRDAQLVIYALAATTTGGITFTDGSSSLTERIDSNAAAAYELLAGAAGAQGTKNITSSAADVMFYSVAAFNGQKILVADGATYALSGGDATLTLAVPAKTAFQPDAFQSNAFQIYGGTVAFSGAYSITADGASFALSGGDANLLYGRRLVADGATYALTGGDASLERGWTVTADGASYALTGGDANLLFGRRLVADGASYALTGGDANLLYGRILTADGDSYALTGGDATLTYTPASAFTLTADGASFAYTGGDANLLYARVMPADGGTYAYTGGDANLLFGRLLSADGATYALSGGDANLTAARVLVADGATYDFAGGDATLTYTPANTLIAEGASYAFTGGDANLIYSGAGTQATQGAAGGRRLRYVAWINGRRYIGSLEEIQALVQVLAEQDAEKAAKGEKPKRRRIVIEAGKPANKPAAQGQKQPEMPQEAVIAVQQDTRRLYELAYAKAMADIEFENDDEESILLLL